jgi:carbonic anhydrase
MRNLLDGFMRFKTDVFPRDRKLFSELACGQKPEALFITCADSRIVPDVITQSRPGDLFMCRTVGNQIPPYGSGSDFGVASSIEYALCALNVPNIIVCGHSDCGAMKAVLHPEKLSGLPSTGSWLRHADAARSVVVDNYLDASDELLLHLLGEENVLLQIEHLKTHPCVAARLARGELQIHGWFYQIHSGEITSFDANTGTFQPLGHRPVSATPPPRFRDITSKGTAA